MKKKVTITDIAQLAGVSKTTISRFLNEKYDGMSVDTKQRIGQVIQDLNYRPNRQARALKAQYSSMIGIVVVDISNSYTSRMIKGIMDRLKNTQYHTLIMDSDINREREQTNVDKLLDEKVDGLIIQPLGEGSADYGQIGNNVAVVQIDRYVEPLLWPAVVSDNFDKSQQLAQMIREKAYQRVIIVSPSLTYATPRIDRYHGLLEAFKGSNIEVKLVITTEVKDIVARDEDLWERVQADVKDDVKTAIYAFNGALLYGMMKLLKKKKIPVSEQVGLVGYDDASLAELVSPCLTSIEQDPVAIGYQAADLLLKKIAAEDRANEATSAELICVKSKINKGESL